MNEKRFGKLLSENLLAVAVSLVALGVYLTTMCPTVSFIDSGELAAVATVLGIAHPTGYPLFTLLGRCAVMVPSGAEEIVKLNVLGGVVSALAVGLFFKLAVALRESLEFVGAERRSRRSSGRRGILACAAIGSLVFGFSRTVWAQSVAVEVYGLHLSLMLLTLLTFVKGVQQGMESEGRIPQNLVLSSFLLGLSFTNHLTTILVIPALGYLYFKSFGVVKGSMLRLVKLMPFFFLGASAYLYLPIRSRIQPPLDWGHPAELERLVWHVSGKQYRSWIFSSFESARKQLSYFISNFPSEFGWLAVALLLIGLWMVYRRNRILFWFLVVTFMTCLLYSINYDIHDIDSYFLLSYVVAGILIVFGLEVVYTFAAGGQRRVLSAVILLFLMTLPLVQLWQNGKAVGESDNHLVEDYTQNIFANLEPNAFVLTFQWDYFVAPSLYYQVVHHQRPDVTIIDKELLRRSWYFIHLEKRYPWLIEQARSKVDAFLAELRKFEHNLPYDAAVIEARYVAMINEFVDIGHRRGATYIGPEIGPEFGAAYERVPVGLLFLLTSKTSQKPDRDPKIRFRSTTYEDRLTNGLRGLYAQMLTLTSSYLLSHHDSVAALSSVEKALAIQPAFLPALGLRDRILKSGQRSGPNGGGSPSK
jgi:hypothetical protein